MWGIAESPGPERLRECVQELRESRQCFLFVNTRIKIVNDTLQRLEGDDGDGTGRKELMSKMLETAKEEIQAGYINM